MYSYHTSFRDTGIFSIYAGTSPDQLPKVLELISTEIERLASKGLSKIELEEAKQQLKGNTLIALESTTNRMNRLATGFLYGIEPQNPEDAIRPYLAVTQDDIRRAAAELLDRKKMAMTVISPASDVSKVLADSPFNAVPCRPARTGGRSSSIHVGKRNG
ncbi:MAG: Peptidase M16 inactive domain protein [bacterium ADurb.Bin374]|nr:MAG: Peptidase M16 inactive domain protein [bacterium ADurb.Bin374]